MNKSALAETVEVEKPDVPAATQLPDPAGYKILVALPEIKELTEGGIAKVQSTIDAETVGSITAFVLKIGSSAYSDKDRFPTGPYCKVGDWIITRSYSGTRISIHGREFRIINDDSVEAVVQDPRGITRV